MTPEQIERELPIARRLLGELAAVTFDADDDDPNVDVFACIEMRDRLLATALAVARDEGRRETLTAINAGLRKAALAFVEEEQDD